MRSRDFCFWLQGWFEIAPEGSLSAFQVSIVKKHLALRRVLLFAGSKSARETFGKLFFESFGVPLQPLGPLAMALQSVEAPDVEAVEKLEPTRWPVARRTA